MVETGVEWFLNWVRFIQSIKDCVPRPDEPRGAASLVWKQSIQLIELQQTIMKLHQVESTEGRYKEKFVESPYEA